MVQFLKAEETFETKAELGFKEINLGTKEEMVGET